MVPMTSPQIPTAPRSILITGVSAGIGLGLTRECLKTGCRVYGLSRRQPPFQKSPEFRFEPCDLGDDSAIAPAIRRLLEGAAHLDLVILNAAVLGQFGDLTTQSVTELQRMMQINVWSNKTILDTLFAMGITIRQVTLISSSAAIHLQRGWGGYAISKAALNAFTRLVAQEYPETHFNAVAPGTVDTDMQVQLRSLPLDPRFPSLEKLRAKQGTADMPSGDDYARQMLDGLMRLPESTASGEYIDLRTLPASSSQT